MKKIFFSIVALAALAACSKSEVAYEATDEIGFMAVAGNMTKTAVEGTAYPTSLNMFIYAETEDNELYIENGEFKHKGTYHSVTNDTEHNANPNVWAGWDSSADPATWYPYYWPNTKKLHFAGYTKSGNVTSANVDYDFTNETLTIEGYEPGDGVDNDLMFFPLTADYGKGDKYVPVNMSHTCAWITFLVKGDGVTGITGSTYTVNSLTITDIYETGDLTCTGNDIVWSYINADTTPKYNKTATSTVLTSNVSLAGTYTNEDEVAPVSAETNEGSTVLLPQVPGKLNLKYSYTSPALDPVEEKVIGLDLSLDTVVEDADAGDEVSRTPWEAGKHYIYTITIKANEILIAPSVAVDWIDGNFNVTVE